MSRLREESAIEAWLVPLAGRLVPRERKAEWTREWEAELWHLRHLGHGDGRRGGDRLVSQASLGWGVVADALWLRWDWLRRSAPGSAEWCLLSLAGVCVLLAGVNLSLMGSWRGLSSALEAYFLHSFFFVAAPAIFAAMVTYPLREMRWQGKGKLRGEWLSVRARWNAFLAAKVLLTLGIAFLSSAAIQIWLGTASAGVFGSLASWLVLIVSAVTVTVGLRWALLNQELRCQKCLRMLREPTRLGPPSHNFLEWSGTELACADGHGLLHVAEMPGSWCWYDRWVELEPWTEAAFY